MIVIVYGPACGKSRHREVLRHLYGCRRVVDGWAPGSPLRDGDLALTNTAPPHRVPGALIVSAQQALARIA